MSHGPFSIEIVEGHDRLIILHEDLHEVRRIYMDGRPFPEDIDNARLAMGFSVGHWEGSTLVIETRGLKRALWDAAGEVAGVIGKIEISIRAFEERTPTKEGTQDAAHGATFEGRSGKSRSRHLSAKKGPSQVGQNLRRRYEGLRNPRHMCY